MTQVFNADEVFKIGVEIERNGRAFYQAAANTTEDADLKKLFEELSDWEARHVELFEGLRSSISGKIGAEIPFDPDNMVHLYLKAVADNSVFVQNSDTAELVAELKTLVNILKKALEFEKESVVFYSSMKEIVSEALGKEEIDKLIHEELNHIGQLTKEVRALSM